MHYFDQFQTDKSNWLAKHIKKTHIAEKLCLTQVNIKISKKIFW